MRPFGDFLITVMREIGYAICHQMPDRTLHYGGRAMPVCARDTGLFMGFAVCSIVLLLVYRRSGARYPSWRKLLCLVVFIIPTFVDAVTSYAGARESSNALRLVTGACAGAGISALFLPLVLLSINTVFECKRIYGMEDLRSEALACRHDRAPAKPPSRMFERWWSLPSLLFVPVVIPLAMRPSFPGAYWLWSLFVTICILFTFFVLNFTLVALARVGARDPEVVTQTGLVLALAVAGALTELAASNRLHWLMTRH